MLYHEHRTQEEIRKRYNVCMPSLPAKNIGKVWIGDSKKFITQHQKEDQQGGKKGF